MLALPALHSPWNSTGDRDSCQPGICPVCSVLDLCWHRAGASQHSQEQCCGLKEEFDHPQLFFMLILTILKDGFVSLSVCEGVFFGGEAVNDGFFSSVHYFCLQLSVSRAGHEEFSAGQ